MFGIGFGELILLFVIALIVFGPEKLPEFAKTMGKYYRQFRDFSDSLKETVERELNLEEFKKINDIPNDVANLVLPKEEVERRKKMVMEKLKKKKETEKKLSDENRTKGEKVENDGEKGRD